jgi:hypothetical protein
VEDGPDMVKEKVKARGVLVRNYRDRRDEDAVGFDQQPSYDIMTRWTHEITRRMAAVERRDLRCRAPSRSCSDSSSESGESGAPPGGGTSDSASRALRSDPEANSQAYFVRQVNKCSVSTTLENVGLTTDKY